MKIPIGIGIWAADDVAIFNKYAQPQDVIAARPPYLDYLKQVEIGRKMLNFNPKDEGTDRGPVIEQAKAMGVEILGYNLEAALPLDQYIQKETEAQEAAAQANFFFVFGPTLGNLLKNFDTYVQYADAIIVQSQRFQATADYLEQTSQIISDIRQANPKIEIWVQVSVNPPENPNISPDQVVSEIQSIADQADLIWIFFAPKMAPAMEEVLQKLRQ
ncbi:MAG: hypothetical protein A2Z49_08415 [Chloroflexi bacterium RBG_19FT_COMBO_56_12]|nr:MAG: hypothetical protein A2Z49_08415 [Chloroflexi bacterium RBG_19FT_COMBO_56_12]